MLKKQVSVGEKIQKLEEAFRKYAQIKIHDATIKNLPDSVGPDNFKPVMKLGQGSFGNVYLVEMLGVAFDPNEFQTGGLSENKRPYYALKVLQKKQILGQNLTRYAKTERDVMTVARHPYIVGLKFAFQSKDKLFLVLDYAPGGTMGRALNRLRKFDEHVAKLYLGQILLAIADLHRQNIIFRDLKPDNIVFDKEGNALLTDFGLAKTGIMNNNGTMSFCGSPAYLAPEILKRQGHGKSVDWYLLGVLLYEMLCGMPPYYSTNKEVLYQNIKHGALKLPSSMSEEARDLIVQVRYHLTIASESQPHLTLGCWTHRCRRDQGPSLFEGFTVEEIGAEASINAKA